MNRLSRSDTRGMTLAQVAVIYACALAGPAAGGTLEHTRESPKAMHVRLKTAHGPVHVFRPRGYEAATAGTVVYVHGYYTDLDGACRHHHLTSQFSDSNLNALFISPEAPRTYTQSVRWESLKELLDTVSASGIELPQGAVVALAHSGGFRTVVPWLSSGLLDTVVLLDGLYGHERDFERWAEAPEHQLVLVGYDTTERIERFVADHDEVERADLPLPEDEVGELENSRLLFLRSTVGHMELVTEGAAIPAVLRLTPLAEVERD